MADVKKPQDHRPKVEKVTVTVGDREAAGRRTTVSGITVTVLDEALDDFELLEDLAALEEQKASRLPSVARRLFGDEYKTVMDALRSEATGRVPIKAASEFIRDVFGALNPN